MKKLFTIAAMFLTFLVGCSEQASVNSPVNDVNTNEPNWISLPQAEGLSVEQSFSSTREIEGDDGGSIYINKTYTTSTGKTVKIYAKAYFPEDAFSGEKNITMTVDDATCTVTFGPSTVFDKALTFNITYTGVNLSGINPSSVKFAYLGTDGSVQYASHSGIVVDVTTGKLQVKNAIIPHFSRYGFVN